MLSRTWALDVASDDPPDEALSCRRRAWDRSLDKGIIRAELHAARFQKIHFGDPCPGNAVRLLGAIFGEGDATKHFSVKTWFFNEKGGCIHWMTGWLRISEGKANQRRDPGHSVNRQTLKIEKFLSSPPSLKSALSYY